MRLGIPIYISFPPPLLIIVGTSEFSITKYIRLIYKPPFGFYISFGKKIISPLRTSNMYIVPAIYEECRSKDHHLKLLCIAWMILYILRKI